jgi:hypothetical protein
VIDGDRGGEQRLVDIAADDLPERQRADEGCNADGDVERELAPPANCRPRIG